MPNSRQHPSLLLRRLPLLPNRSISPHPLRPRQRTPLGPNLLLLQNLKGRRHLARYPKRWRTPRCKMRPLLHLQPVDRTLRARPLGNRRHHPGRRRMGTFPRRLLRHQTSRNRADRRHSSLVHNKVREGGPLHPQKVVQTDPLSPRGVHRRRCPRLPPHSALPHHRRQTGPRSQVLQASLSAASRRGPTRRHLQIRQCPLPKRSSRPMPARHSQRVNRPARILNARLRRPPQAPCRSRLRLHRPLHNNQGRLSLLRRLPTPLRHHRRLPPQALHRSQAESAAVAKPRNPQLRHRPFFRGNLLKPFPGACGWVSPPPSKSALQRPR